MNKIKEILALLSKAHDLAYDLQNEYPELGRFEIGNIDSLAGLVSQAYEVGQHVEGNIKNLELKKLLELAS
jgi:hypothetical protein